MGMKLQPLSVAELCVHALELGRDAADRFRQYAARMRDLDEPGVAAVFEEMTREEDEEVQALTVAAGEHKAGELSAWEYVWRLTYLPDGQANRPRAVPMSAREALQLAAMAKRRGESFFRDVEDGGRDVLVRGCAAEMAMAERRKILRIEKLLESTPSRSPFAPASGVEVTAHVGSRTTKSGALDCSFVVAGPGFFV